MCSKFDYAFDCVAANWAPVQRLQSGPRLPNFGMLYQVPEAKSSSSSGYSEAYDEYETQDSDELEYESSFYLSPRMACKLFWHGVVLSSMWQEDSELWLEEALPPAALPYLKKKRWVDAFLQCLKRLVCRVLKGLGPAPNCTGEEMALHLLIKYCADMDDDNEYTETLNDNLQLLPQNRLDSSFELISHHSMKHNRVLMLYNPELEEVCLSSGGGHREQYLHPKDWFVAFNQEHAFNHAL